MYPVHQLFITVSLQLPALHLLHHFIGNRLGPCCIIFQRKSRFLFRKILVHQLFGQHDRNGIASVRVKGPDQDIVNISPHRKGGVGGQGPRGCGPGQDIQIGVKTLQQSRGTCIPDHLELGYNRGILYIPVTAGLVELMGTESAAGCRRIRLDGIPFV